MASALDLAAHHLAVFPLHTPTPQGCSCGRSDCHSPGKHPRINGGVHTATTDFDQLRTWWKRWPDANIGLATGNGLTVIDIDGPTGTAGLARLEEALGALPPTRTVTTGNGQHIYLHTPPHIRIPNSASTIAAGIDIRSNGGYVVAPPSLHHSGHHYTLNNNTNTIAAAPGSWLAHLATPPRPVNDHPGPVAAPVAPEGGHPYALAALTAEAHRVATAPPGTRNHTLNRAAYNLGRLCDSGGLRTSEIHETLGAAAAEAGLGDNEAHVTIASGLAAGRDNPKPIPTRTPQPAATRRKPARVRPGPVLLQPHGPAGWQWTVTHGATTTTWRTGPHGNGLYKHDPKRDTWNPVRLQRPFHVPPDRTSAYRTIIRSFTARPPRTPSLGEAASTDDPHRPQRQTIGLGR